MKKKDLLVVATITALILSIPLIAMQFTEEVDWNIADFILMGTLIFITGMGIGFALKTKNKYRYIIVGVILLGFLMLWAEMAVGIFGSPIAGS
jgi:hypothetical protein